MELTLGSAVQPEDRPRGDAGVDIAAAVQGVKDSDVFAVRAVMRQRGEHRLVILLGRQHSHPPGANQGRHHDVILSMTNDNAQLHCQCTACGA